MAKTNCAIARLRLLSHARQFGIDRLRESAAIVTAVSLNNRTGESIRNMGSFLLSTSRQGLEITRAQMNTLQQYSRDQDGNTDMLVMNRLIDAVYALKRRREAGK